MNTHLRLLPTVVATAVIGSVGGTAMELARDGAAAAPVYLAAESTAAERTAATELATYLGRVTGGRFEVVAEPAAPPAGPGVWVGPTAVARQAFPDLAALGPEEWVIRTVGDRLVLAGGRPRGTLYAVYHFLEDQVGVHWWNPWEESVPSRPTLVVTDLDRRGRPVIRYRDIYMLYGNDGGRFAARNRLNRDGDSRIVAEYGGGLDYGPPYHVHTFYLYIPPKDFLGPHPEYFSLIDGKRSADHAQLCLTNPDVRREMTEKLLAFVAADREQSKTSGRPPPLVYDISQNDWLRPCQCQTCQAVVTREGSEAGPLIEFVNALAEAVAARYPDVCLDTLAYQYTQKPPRTVRPRDNVIIRLCDTDSNFTQPITAPVNQAFRDTLLAWAAIAKNLRIWDYAVTYAAPQGLPFPSVHTFAPDFRFYAEHNVEGVFTELEFPITADLRDLKVWSMMKLLEDPYADPAALLQTFTDGFYGAAAGPRVREYLALLETAAAGKRSHIGMGTGASAFSHLDLRFTQAAHALFDQAETAVAGDPVLLRRLRHARLGLDRATVVLYRRFASEWSAQGQDAARGPFDRDAVAARIRDTWSAQADLRLPVGARKAELAAMDSELTRCTLMSPNAPLPERFRSLPPGTVHDFTADLTRNWQDIVGVVKDPDAESGITNRLEFPTAVETEEHPLEKYRLPMPWGLYSPLGKAGVASAQIRPEDVPGPGYHWYRLGTSKIGPTYYLYFFWSWIIQIDLDTVIDAANPDQPFGIWARLKFEGPAFPHGQAQAKNAICVERVVLVKAAPAAGR